MRNFKKILLACSILGGLLTLVSTTTFKQKHLRHVVAFNYKPDVSEADKQKVITAFYALKDSIPQIIAFEGGKDIQKTPGKKFTQCFIVTVKDEKDLGIYGSHPKHKAFSAFVDPLLAEVMVVDYWAE